MFAARNMMFAGAFSPLQLGPQLWLSDTGSDASVWPDLSGNGWSPTQATAGSRPAIITNSLNGRQVRRFDGVDDILIYSTATAALRNVPGATIFVVAKWIVSPAALQFLAFISNGAISTRAGLGGGFSANKQFSGGRRLDADSFARVDSSASVSTSAHKVISAVFDYANSNLDQYLNGSLDGTTTTFQTDGNTSDTNASALSVGAFWVSGGPPHNNFANADIAEIIIYPTALSTGNRERVQQYLNSKYAVY